MFNELTANDLVKTITDTVFTGTGLMIGQGKTTVLIPRDRDNVGRICLYSLTDCSIVLSLEYGQGRLYESTRILEYFWGWQFIDDNSIESALEVAQKWLNEVHKL